MRYKGIKGKVWEAVKAWSRRTRKDCYTCKAKSLFGRNAHAGHYQPVSLVGSNNKKAWDSRFIRLQCGHCNGAGQGMQNVFRANLVKEHGEAVVAQFDREVAAYKTDPVKDWQALLKEYQEIP